MLWSNILIMRFPKHSFIQYVKFFLGLFEVLLAIRVVLKFLTASSRAVVVDFIYTITDIINVPFGGIFTNRFLRNGSEVDVVAVSAMLGYPIIVYLVMELIHLISKDPTDK
ncbi:MAG: hypothetical protein AAB617_02820 [Patescibacteria group bacterium]